MTVIGQHNLAPTSPAERLHDIIDRYWQTHGKPPAEVLANYGFRHEFAQHVMLTEPWLFGTAYAPVPFSNEFLFRDVPVRCVLQGGVSVLVIR